MDSNIKSQFLDIKTWRLLNCTVYLFIVRILSCVSFHCSYITCKYWVGLPLALNTASTCLCIESFSSITDEGPSGVGGVNEQACICIE